ncbi:hypothetical protein Tco_1086189 [Tanacetum coccineum]
MEFPTFKGDDVRGWLYKCEQFFRINDVQVLVEYSDAFKSLFNIVSLLSDMGEDETHFVDLFIEGLHPGIGSVVRRFLDKVSKARDESNGFESKKSSEGKGFEVSDVYVKESIEVKNGLVDGFVVEAVTCDLDGFDDILGEVTVRGLKNLDGVVMDGEPVFVKANKECFIEMALDPQGRMQTAREKDDLELEYRNEIVYKCMGRSMELVGQSRSGRSMEQKLMALRGYIGLAHQEPVLDLDSKGQNKCCGCIRSCVLISTFLKTNGFFHVYDLHYVDPGDVVKYSKEPDNPTNSVAVEAQENGPRRAKAEAQVEARRKKDFEREPTHHTLLKVYINATAPAYGFR